MEIKVLGQTRVGLKIRGFQYRASTQLRYQSFDNHLKSGPWFAEVWYLRKYWNTFGLKITNSLVVLKRDDYKNKYLPIIAVILASMVIATLWTAMAKMFPGFCMSISRTKSSSFMTLRNSQIILSVEELIFPKK